MEGIPLRERYKHHFGELARLAQAADKIDDTEAHSRYIELAKLYEPRMTEASVAIGKLDRGINQRAADNSDRYLTSLYY